MHELTVKLLWFQVMQNTNHIFIGIKVQPRITCSRNVICAQVIVALLKPHHQFEYFFVNDPKQYLELNILLNITNDCGGDMGDWLGPLSNSIMMALIPLCVLPWCQCAHTKPDPTHPISYWTVIYISTALYSALGKSLNADKTRGAVTCNCTWCPHCSCSRVDM